MPSFLSSVETAAAVEDVWKLLYDPARFPEWWMGIETVETSGDGTYTVWTVGSPDFPIAQRLSAEPTCGVVTISCLVSDLEFRWQLAEAGTGTKITVDVELPEREAWRLSQQQKLIAASLQRLAELSTAD